MTHPQDLFSTEAAEAPATLVDGDPIPTVTLEERRRVPRVKPAPVLLPPLLAGLYERSRYLKRTGSPFWVNAHQRYKDCVRSLRD